MLNLEGWTTKPLPCLQLQVMSIGKFEPSYFNAYSRPRPHHGNSIAKDYDSDAPSGQTYFNGFSPNMNERRGNANHDPVQSDVDEPQRDCSARNRPENGSDDTDLKKYIHIEVHPNGGASVVRIYDNEISSLSTEEREKLAQLFFEEVFCEESDHVAKHVIGIVQGAVTYMPELVNYLALVRPDLDIKVGPVSLPIASFVASDPSTVIPPNDVASCASECP